MSKPIPPYPKTVMFVCVCGKEFEIQTAIRDYELICECGRCWREAGRIFSSKVKH